MISIKVLLENNTSEHKALKAEHGLSFWIEKDNKKILFDCSSNKIVLENASKMGVNTQTADYVVISHSHYDHAAGYKAVVEAGCKAPLYIGRNFFEPKYAKHSPTYTYLGCGFEEQFLKEHHITYYLCDKKERLFEGCYLVSDFERTTSFEKIPERFVKQQKGQMVQDDFKDEVCIVLESEKGLVVVVGCSHPGIINMLQTIQRRLELPIYAVFGGSHLVEGNEKRIKATLHTMKQMNIKVLGLNHCTGEDATHYLEMNSEEILFSTLRVGDCYWI